MADLIFNCPGCGIEYGAQQSESQTFVCKTCGTVNKGILIAYISERNRKPKRRAPAPASMPAANKPSYIPNQQTPSKPPPKYQIVSPKPIPTQHNSIWSDIAAGALFIGLIVILIGLVIIPIYNHFKGSDVKQNLNISPQTSTDASQSSTNVPETYVVPPPETIAKMTQERMVSDSSKHSLSSLIDSSGITFDENFHPIATIRLHNSTSKEIDQIMFRFTFAVADEQDGSLSYILANEYSSYSYFTVSLKAGDSKTGKVLIPPAQHKNFDSPTISVVKVRYFDGSITTDDR